ncbi:MAG: hypothetical protein ACUVWP_07035 [bacterium]
MKYKYLILFVCVFIIFLSCSEEKNKYPYVRMVDRLVGEGDTKGWGSDLGVIFRHNGKIYTLGGDTSYDDIFASNIIGSTTDNNPSDGLDIVWQNKNGGPKQFFSQNWCIHSSGGCHKRKWHNVCIYDGCYKLDSVRWKTPAFEVNRLWQFILTYMERR